MGYRSQPAGYSTVTRHGGRRGVSAPSFRDGAIPRFSLVPKIKTQLSQRAQRRRRKEWIDSNENLFGIVGTVRKEFSRFIVYFSKLNFSLLSSCSLCVLRVLCAKLSFLFKKTCQLESWRSQEASSVPSALSVRNPVYFRHTNSKGDVPRKTVANTKEHTRRELRPKKWYD